MLRKLWWVDGVLTTTHFQGISSVFELVYCSRAFFFEPALFIPTGHARNGNQQCGTYSPRNELCWEWFLCLHWIFFWKRSKKIARLIFGKSMFAVIVLWIRKKAPRCPELPKFLAVLSVFLREHAKKTFMSVNAKKCAFAFLRHRFI